jgi:bla regulator protein blaR1
MIQWMLYAVAVSGLAGLAALGAERALIQRGVPLRWLWALALACSLGLSAVPWLGFGSPAGEPESTALEGSAQPVTGVADGGGFAGPWSSNSEFALLGALERPLVGLWLIFSLGGALFVGAVHRNLARRRQSWRPTTVEGVQALISRDIGPAVVGFREPAIVLPAWVLELEPAQREMVVAHEFEHLVEGDSRLLGSALFALLLMPWNLPLWWQVRRLRKATELDCDARVVEGGCDALSYGELLIEVGERSVVRSFAYAAFANSATFLETRITNLFATRPRPWRAAVDGVLSLSLLTLALAFHAPAPPLALGGPPGGSAAETAAARATTIEAAVAPDFAYEVAVLERVPELSNKGVIGSVMERLYPRLLQDAGIGGTVVMEFVIEPDGTVDMNSAKVLESSNDQLSQASMKAIERFRFRPGRYNGENVRVLVQMPITWQAAG